MTIKLNLGEWVELAEVSSTQAVAADMIRLAKTPKVVIAEHQTAGHGRFDRTWYSEKGHSLTASILFDEYADHPKPWLLGMSVALAAASVLHAKVWWPNDVVYNGKKVGGILTEVMTDPIGRKIPVIGIGLNLSIESFPKEIAHRAVSHHEFSHTTLTPKEALEQILIRLEELPDPSSWANIQKIWMLFDATPGKCYQLPTGETATAMGFGPDGELLCSVDGETRSVMAAEALFGLQFD